MKYQLPRSVIFIAFVFLLSTCAKFKKDKISYPTQGLYGKNILALNTADSLIQGQNYSLNANLEKKATLKIVIKNSSTQGNPVWFYSEQGKWLVSDYSSSQQEFIANDDGNLDLNIIFENGPGSCLVDFYENSSSVTQTKYFKW